MKLTVYDNQGASASQFQTITVKRDLPPVAQYDYYFQTERGDLVVQFDATSSFDPEGPIVEYFWDFNDSHKKTPYSNSGWLQGLLNKLGWKKNSVADVYGHKSMETYAYSSSRKYEDLFKEGSDKYYYLKDVLGTVTDITDSSGSIVQHYDYESFGKIRRITDGTQKDITSDSFIRASFTYTGREYDEESGLYYYRARYYDPSIGRFLQQDPDPGRVQTPITVINKYAYVGNNPNIFTDSTGRNFFEDLFGFVVLAVTGVTLMSVGIPLFVLDPAIFLTGLAMVAEVTLVLVLASALASALALVATPLASILLLYAGSSRLPKLEMFHGMPLVKNSLLSGIFDSLGFSLGMGSFVAYSENEKELGYTMMHEYGHRLQYKDWGGWAYIKRGVEEKGDPHSLLEKNADQRACEYFGTGKFVPRYGRGKKCNEL